MKRSAELLCSSPETVSAGNSDDDSLGTTRTGSMSQFSSSLDLASEPRSSDFGLGTGGHSHRHSHGRDRDHYHHRGHLHRYRDATNDDDGTNQGRGFCFGSAEKPNCLVRELNQMPSDYQRSAGQDVVGLKVPDEVEDVPSERIQQLEIEISKLDETERQVFDLAMQLNETFTRSMMMPFLRSVEGSAKRAAKRITRHFRRKLEIFGRGKLVKTIEISDLNDDDLEALYSGGFQVLPMKDRAGRPILFGRYTCMKYRHTDNMVRALWYTWSTMVEDEEFQKSGIVAIGFENGRLPLERTTDVNCFDELGTDVDVDDNIMLMDSGFDRDVARAILGIPLCLPIRPIGYHICADTVQWQSIFDMVMVTICKFVRVRLRFHYGTMQESKYALMTQGIPVDCIPVNDEGDVDLTNHYEWIEYRRTLEESRQQQQQNYMTMKQQTTTDVSPPPVITTTTMMTTKSTSSDMKE